ncbi:MAG: TolC family protein [Bacteroidota bacterium]
MIIINRRNFLFIAFFLFHSLSAFSAKVWSLQDCIDYALANNIEIKQRILNENASEEDLSQSYSNFLPSLNADVSHGYSYGRSVDPFTNDFSTERIMRQNGSATGSVLLFSGFQNVNYLRMNMHRNTAMRYDTERVSNDIILSIGAAYMQILYNEDFLETAREQVEIIEQQLERTRILFEGGTVAKGSVLELEARLSEEKLNLITAENNLRLSYLELMHLLDLDPGEDFDIEQPDVDITNGFIMDNHEQVFEKAVQIEPSVKRAEENILVAEKLVEIEKGRLSPSLSLIGNLGTGYSQAAEQFAGQENMGSEQIGYLEDNTPVFADKIINLFETKPYADQVRDNFSQYIGLNLRIPIFDRMEIRNRIQQSKIELQRAKNNYEQNRNNLNKIIGQAHADALAAYQKYQATVKSLDSFRESFKYTQQRFDLGMVSYVEFNESQIRLARAQREALQAKYDYVFKQKIMEFYIGEGFNL